MEKLIPTFNEFLNEKYDADEWIIKDPKKVAKRTTELKLLKLKRKEFIKNSYAYKNLTDQINQLEKMKITNKKGKIIAWKKFDDED